MKDLKTIGKLMEEKDIPSAQLSQMLKGNVVEFARNEVNRSDLAQLAYAYQDDAQNFIADKVSPIYPVTTLTGKYRKLNENTFYDEPEVMIGKDEHPNKVSWGSAYVNFDLSGRALAIFMSNIDRDEAVNQFGSVAKWRAINVQLLTRLLLIQREREVATMFQTPATYFASGYYSTPTAWSGVTTLPKSDVITAIDTPLLAPADTLIVSHDVFRVLQKHADIRSDVTISASKRSLASAYVDSESIRNYFDVKNLIVGEAMYNSTPGASTPTFTRIWQNYLTICHLGDPMGGNELAPTFSRTLKLQSDSFPNVNGWTVKTVQDGIAGVAGGELLMVGYWVQPIIYAQKAGYSLKVL